MLLQVAMHAHDVVPQSSENKHTRTYTVKDSFQTGFSVLFTTDVLTTWLLATVNTQYTSARPFVSWAAKPRADLTTCERTHENSQKFLNIFDSAHSMRVLGRSIVMRGQYTHYLYCGEAAPTSPDKTNTKTRKQFKCHVRL